MNTEIFQFKLGSLECTAVCDGKYIYGPPVYPPPAAFLFTDAPKDQIMQEFHNHNLKSGEWSTWISSFNCLLVDSGEHKVLIDTGAGSLGPDTGRLLKNLREAGASPNSIDRVILTHGHPDHIGGCTDAQGRLTFPKASYVMSKDEWNFWRSGRAEKEIREYNRETLLKIEYGNLPAILNQVNLVEGEVEILPGISILPAPGHTPGQIAVMITSRGQKLLYISDMLFHPIQVAHPEWSGIADLNPEQTVITRRRFLEMAANQKALVMGFHFPFPGLGRVIKQGERYKWQIAETNLSHSSWELKQ